MKAIKVTLVLISLVWTGWNVMTAILSKTVVNLLSLTALVPILTALYTEVDWIYIKINKFLAFHSANTVSLEPRFSRISNSTRSLEEIDQKIRSILQNENIKVYDKRSAPNNHENLYYTVLDENQLKFNLNLSKEPCKEGERISLKGEYQVSYRDVDKTWKEFVKLKSIIFNTFSNKEDEIPRADIMIRTNDVKFNPFYRLTVRHLDNKKIERFNLKFSEGDLEVTTSLHQIYATSKDEADIEKVISEYVPLSKIL
ncbi:MULTISPECIES: hypothetical protein [Latilactobacillus]|uniref:hypothetical protein n=1 Tax=Latilactobacillus TaxID=2767885 RepID=UPI0015F6E1F7|nr:MULTISPECIES: hypothetical protein [Latilactobacillus]QMU86679.1 hypothetical protein H3M14_01425 [Latilactobacillus sakei]WIE01493.1 hypothetical protein QN289_03815 [Latilactobacillus curvatus]